MGRRRHADMSGTGQPDSDNGTTAEEETAESTQE